MTPFGDTNEDDYDNVNNVNNVDIEDDNVYNHDIADNVGNVDIFYKASVSFAKFQNQFNSGIEEARLSSSKVFLYFFSVLLLVSCFLFSMSCFWFLLSFFLFPMSCFGVIFFVIIFFSD